MTVYLHHNDLPAGLTFGATIAIDSETMGLNLRRDRLCLLQLSDGQGDVHLIKFSPDQAAQGLPYHAPNLCALLADPSKLKLLHYARFDMAAIQIYLGLMLAPVYCTKIASKLVRTYTSSHGLKSLVQEILGIDISKMQQSSDWGQEELSQAQQDYAAGDVLYLHAIKDKLDTMLAREGRTQLAQACFEHLKTRVLLDIAGFEEMDIFSHS